MSLIKKFNELSKEDVSIAGGKGASLGEMMQAGFPIPYGFVVLASAFDEFIKETDLNVEIDAILKTVDTKAIHTVDEASEKIQSLILNAKMPIELTKDIERFHNELGADFVAVRSSATSEDSADAAWAGQLDSYLNTNKENLFSNIQKCWASLFTPRAIFYRFEKGLESKSISVAVVVQSMIQSDVSGVAFSVHPVTQDQNQLIIEASYGLGEAIVSGQVTPDSYVLSKEPSKIIDKNIFTQEKGLFSSEMGGNVWKEIPKGKAENQVLSDNQIEELAEIIISVENHYDFPCDIEWAIEDEKLFITQSRPITTISLQQERTQKKEYIFMWGTAPVLPSFYATPQAQKERKDVLIPSDGSFQYFDGKVLTAFMATDELDETRKKDSIKFLNPDYYEEYVKNFNSEYENWWKWIREIETKDYSTISNQELGNDHKTFSIFQRDSICYFGSTRPELTFAAEERLKEILKKYFDKDWATVFGVFTISEQLDDVQKEQLDFTKLVSQEYSENNLLAHTSKYPWLVFGQFDENKVVEFLKEMAENFKDRNFKAKLKQIEQEKKENTKKKGEYLAKLDYEDKKEAIFLARLLQEQSVRRMDIKSFWIGSYYLARNFWNTLANRLNLDVWDFIKYVFPFEIQALLNDSFDGNIQDIISERKKSYAINYSGKGEIEVLNGAEADQVYRSKIKQNQEYDNVIKGQTAALGVYLGPARKVMPGDLEMLKESVRDFKEGEVLVTTMTQPNMMVIAKRAGAIITDEGGITSHAAIISRELKIPCIVGCLHAMQAINNGDVIEVNANEGIVNIKK